MLLIEKSFVHFYSKIIAINSVVKSLTKYLHYAYDKRPDGRAHNMLTVSMTEKKDSTN